MGGSIDLTLQHALEGGQKNCDTLAKGLLGEDQPAYCVFDQTLKGPERFDREMLELLNPDGVIAEGTPKKDATLGDFALAQTQYALLSQLSRDFRMRRRTRIQAHAHGIVRTQALGHKSGLLTVPLLERLKVMLESGSPPA